MWTCSQEVLRIVLMAGKTSGDSSKRVSHDIFRAIHESFTTQGLPAGSTRFTANRPPHHGPVKCPCSTLHGVVFAFFVGGTGWLSRGDCNPGAPGALGRWMSGATPMPYALYCNDAKLSK